MKHRGLKFLFLLLSLALLVGLLSGMSAYAEDYPIWIGNMQVTSDNTSGPTWSYDNSTKTLTLDGFSWTADTDYDVGIKSGNTGCIYIDDSSDSNVTIVLKGVNTLTNNISYGSGIFSKSALTFSGSGSLTARGALYGISSFSNITVNSGNITADGNSYGLNSMNGVIEIRGGTVTAKGNNAGISSPIGNIIITGGTVTADGGTRGPGILTAVSSVKIDGGTVTASGAYGIYSMDGELQINGGTVIASGSQKAIDCKVKNTIAGTGWTDAAGTQGQATIAVNTEGQSLSAYKKVQFPAAADSFTVTYQPGDGASLKDGIQPPDGYTVDGQNIVKTGVKGEYQIEGLESCFNAPEGKVFDCWKDANGAEYRAPQKVNVTANLTLTAQWKEEKKPDGGEKKTSGGGSGFDLVFNIPGEDNSWEYVGGGYAPQQAYRVSLAPMQGGSAALGLTTGDSGTQMNVYPSTTVYVFPNAEQGYTLDKIVWSLIDGSASYDITEAKNFVMPAMDVVVYVTFRPLG